MAVQGCHSCKVNPYQYTDVPYQDTPCAKCALSRQTNKTFKRTELFDSDAVADQIQKIQYQSGDDDCIPEWVPDKVIQTIRKACESNMMVTLSNVILRMVKLSKEFPVMFQILTAKMQHPQLSYYQIGQSMDPPCSKQNVLYHLKHAVQQFPELASSIITDTRFSGGKYAIKTVASIMQQIQQVAKVQKALYSQVQTNRTRSIQELNKLFKQPSKQAKAINMYDEYKQD